MSNPISYFFALSTYEDSFRKNWLKQAIPAAEYQRVQDLHITLLRDLYPAVYTYGPNGQHVIALIKALADAFNEWTTMRREATMLMFIRELDDIFHGKFPLHTEVLHQLQQANRLSEVYLYNPQPSDDTTAKTMQTLLDAMENISARAPISSDIRLALPKNLESLLSIAAAADLTAHDSRYKKLIPAYLKFLERWDLPLAKPAPHSPSSAPTQEKLSYIPDY